MKKYINEYGKECYKNVTGNEAFTNELFHNVESKHTSDNQIALHTNLGSITVLDRAFGYGFALRDTETGFRSPEGKFWLASGMRDVRKSGAKTIRDAIQWIKSNANICTGG